MNMICYYYNIKCRNIKDKGFVGILKDVIVSCGNASFFKFCRCYCFDAIYRV